MKRVGERKIQKLHLGIFGTDEETAPETENSYIVDEKAIKELEERITKKLTAEILETVLGMLARQPYLQEQKDKEEPIDAELDSAAFWVMTMSSIEKPIHFYLSEEGLDWVQKLIALEKHVLGTFGYMLDYLQSCNRIKLSTMKEYEEYELSGKKVTPLKTNHPGYGMESLVSII